ncbi:MAG: hypothetical protein RL630_1639 [Verrucomicrobiota bacterium]
MDSFFARYIQRLFGFRDMNRFTAFLEYVLRQSGGQFDVSKAASELGIARATVESHLRALETTHAATSVRPFHRGSRTEIVKQPKVYAFDTGFVSFVRGWNPLRPDDFGPLWEHLVLETLQARLPDAPPLYWRDKNGREIDFVILRDRDSVDAIECKWNPDAFDADALATFRAIHPQGRNFLVCPASTPAHVRSSKGLEIRVVNPMNIPA